MILALGLAAMLLVGCGAKADITGKWTAPDLAEQMGLGGMGEAMGEVVYEFTKDGKMVTTIGGKSQTEFTADLLRSAGMTEDQIAEQMKDAPEMTYKVDGNKITMTMKAGEEVSEQTGEFKLDGDSLTLPNSGGGDIVLTRVK